MAHVISARIRFERGAGLLALGENKRGYYTGVHKVVPCPLRKILETHWYRSTNINRANLFYLLNDMHYCARGQLSNALKALFTAILPL